MKKTIIYLFLFAVLFNGCSDILVRTRYRIQKTEACEQAITSAAMDSLNAVQEGMTNELRYDSSEISNLLTKYPKSREIFELYRTQNTISTVSLYAGSYIFGLGSVMFVLQGLRPPQSEYTNNAFNNSVLTLLLSGVTGWIVSWVNAESAEDSFFKAVDSYNTECKGK